MSPPLRPLSFTCPVNGTEASPRQLALSGWDQHRTDSPLGEQRRQEHAESNANMGISMPVAKFQEMFLPVPSDAESRPMLMSVQLRDKIKDLVKRNDERGLADAWAGWMSSLGKKAPCPGYQLHLSQDRWDEGDAYRLKVDAAIHPADSIPNDGRPHWEKQSGLIEFKVTGTKADPYDDNTGSDADAQTRVSARGQLTAYVAHAFAHQHRTAMFLFLVNGTRLRATRWDRSGTIFTESFDYTEDRQTLRKLMWGFALAQENEKGIDATALPLGPEDADYKLMDAIAEPCADDISEEEGTIVEKDGPYTFRFVRDAFRTSLAKDYPRYRVSIPTEDGIRDFLVARPDVVAPGMAGRGTRGFIAYDVKTKRFTFLKDAWRPFYENVDTEGEVLRQLKKAGVRNIPTIVCDGELDHCTKTPLYAEQALKDAEEAEQKATQKTNGKTRGTKRTRKGNAIPPVSPPALKLLDLRKKNMMRHFRHYRLVVEEICLPMSSFKNGHEFIRVVRDCVEAHADAAQKANLLHRDISAGNVMIHPTVVTGDDGIRRVVHRGMLIDWELSKPMTLDGEKHIVRQPCRTGTWQFTSVHLLDNPTTHVEIADELESVFHVILYGSLRYLRSSCLNVNQAMFEFFDAYDFKGEAYKCGNAKRTAIEGGKLPKVFGESYSFLDDNGTKKHPINYIVQFTLKWTKARYEKIEAAKDAKDNKDAKDEPVRIDDVDDLDHLASVFAQAKDTPAKLDPVASQRDATAANLDDHVAMLKVLNFVLTVNKNLPWPVKDKVGDIVKDPSLAHVTQIEKDVSKLVNNQNDNEAGEGEPDEDGKLEPKQTRTKKARKNAATVTFAIEDEDEDEEMEPAPPAHRRFGNVLRTRGGVRTRPMTRAGTSRSRRTTG